MSLDIAGAISRGGKAAQEEVEANQNQGLRREKVNWFSIKKNERIVVRFLDDASEWPNVRQHPFAPTRPAPANKPADANWPTMLSPVCRKTPQFVQFFPDGCYICDHMHEVRPNEKAKNKHWYGQVRCWARGVQREEVLVETAAQAEEYGLDVGDVLGYRDYEDEVDEVDDKGEPTGKKIMKKRIIVFNGAWKNFFGPLQGFADAFKGTVLDRDYSITRTADGKDTDYNIVPLDKIELADGTVFDMRMPEVIDGKPTGRKLRDAYLDDAPDLIKMIEDRIVDEFYDRFYDDRKPEPVWNVREGDDTDKGGNNGKASTPAPAKESRPATEAPSAPADAAASKAKLDAFRQRVRGGNPAPDQSEDGQGAAEEGTDTRVPATAGGRRKGPAAL